MRVEPSNLSLMRRILIAFVSLLAVSISGTLGTAAPATAAVPGSVTAMINYNAAALTLTYDANATGWSRTTQVCMTWRLYYQSGGDTLIDSGQKCGTGSVAINSKFIWCPRPGSYKMVAHAWNGDGVDDHTRYAVVF